MVEGPENSFHHLQQFLASQAETLLMRVGSPPTFYENGQSRDLCPTETDPGDVLSIMKSIAPDAQHQLLKVVGSAEFDMQLPGTLLHVTAVWSEAVKEVRFSKRN